MPHSLMRSLTHSLIHSLAHFNHFLRMPSISIALFIGKNKQTNELKNCQITALPRPKSGKNKAKSLLERHAQPLIIVEHMRVYHLNYRLRFTAYESVQ